jgi:hypothetical protein
MCISMILDNPMLFGDICFGGICISMILDNPVLFGAICICIGWGLGLWVATDQVRQLLEIQDREVQ